jgi:hypothetical protein
MWNYKLFLQIHFQRGSIIALIIPRDKGANMFPEALLIVVLFPSLESSTFLLGPGHETHWHLCFWDTLKAPPQKQEKRLMLMTPRITWPVM